MCVGVYVCCYAGVYESRICDDGTLKGMMASFFSRKRHNGSLFFFSLPPKSQFRSGLYDNMFFFLLLFPGAVSPLTRLCLHLILLSC